jgi:signal transduction histidine kinase
MLGLFTVAVVFVSGETYRQQALDTQRTALLDLAQLEVDDLLQDLGNTSRDLGLAVQQDPQFRKLFRSRDSEALEALLKNQFEQYFVTAGLLIVERLDILDADYNLVSQTSHDGSYTGREQFICPDLVMRARKRTGTERLKAVSELCLAAEHPYHALIIPIGLRLEGYLQVTTDPAHNLIPLETTLGMPLALSLPNGISLYRSADWGKWNQDEASLLTSFSLETRNGEPALSISLHSDIQSFHDQLEQTRTLVMLFVSLLTILAVLIARLIVSKIVLEPLETKVQERTRELSNANIKLQAEIAERKRAEEELQLRQAELAHVARQNIMGEMASGLAHEINQPLAAIVNYMKGCIRRLQSGPIPTPELLTVMERSAMQAERAGRIISRIRNFLRKEETSPVMVDINKIVRDAAEFIEPEARRHGITIRLELSKDALPALVDPIGIEQVILNLIHNGIEAMKSEKAGKPEVTIATTVVEGKYAEVAISDMGSGIPQDLVARVFDPFFSTKPDGLGMGLSICRSIIEAHDNKLWVEHNSHDGVTFRFRLAISNEDNKDAA